MAGFGKAMQQHDGVALAGDEVMQPDSVDVGELVFHWFSFAASKTTFSIIAGDRTIVWCFSVRQIECYLVDIAPAPPFRRIIALDDRVTGSVEMFGRVLVGGIVATANVAATAADSQM